MENCADGAGPCKIIYQLQEHVICRVISSIQRVKLCPRCVCTGYAGKGAGEGRDGTRDRCQSKNGHEGGCPRHCFLSPRLLTFQLNSHDLLHSTAFSIAG